MKQAVDDGPIREDLRIPCDNVELRAVLNVPQYARGLILFAHGSGSSRLSPRNKLVARILRDAGFGSLLMDLLSAREDRMQRTRFDVDLLARRLEGAYRWTHANARIASLPVGLFGASTGAAAAIRVAAMPESNIAAVVSRGGRPDLAGREALGAITAPTLLIVGGFDTGVIALNEAAEGNMHCERRLEIVSGATHLFEEPGTLEEAAGLACAWFVRHLSPPGPQSPLTPSIPSPSPSPSP
jgi:putative phosphoribosyl transferase